MSARDGERVWVRRMVLPVSRIRDSANEGITFMMIFGRLMALTTGELHPH